MSEKYEPSYSITNLKGTTIRTFEINRARLGLSADAYLVNLLKMDYTGEACLTKVKRVDLNQSRLYGAENGKT